MSNLTVKQLTVSKHAKVDDFIQVRDIINSRKKDESSVKVSNLDRKECWYGSNRLLGINMIESILLDPAMYVNTDLLDSSLNYDPKKDIMYLGESKKALLGLFEDDKLICVSVIRCISTMNYYYTAIYFMMSHREHSSVEKNKYMLERSIEKMMEVSSGVVYACIPKAFENTSYIDVILKYDYLELFTIKPMTAVKGSITNYVLLDNTKPFFAYEASVYSMRKNNGERRAA